jgi:protein toll
VSFLRSISNKIDDVTCDGNDKEVKEFDAEICSGNNLVVLIVSITVGIFILFVAIVAVLYYKYQVEIKVWLFAHKLLLWLICEEDLDKDKTYDAFISYSHKDEEFVTEHLVPTLETKMRLKACWHVRDWTPGELILTQVRRPF